MNGMEASKVPVAFGIRASEEGRWRMVAAMIGVEPLSSHSQNLSIGPGFHEDLVTNLLDDVPMAVKARISSSSGPGRDCLYAPGLLAMLLHLPRSNLPQAAMDEIGSTFGLC